MHGSPPPAMECIRPIVRRPGPRQDPSRLELPLLAALGALVCKIANCCICLQPVFLSRGTHVPGDSSSPFLLWSFPNADLFSWSATSVSSLQGLPSSPLELRGFFRIAAEAALGRFMQQLQQNAAPFDLSHVKRKHEMHLWAAWYRLKQQLVHLIGNCYLASGK